jgi:hypothetical protein
MDQMTDSLIWRSAPDGKRTYSERRKALEGLIALTRLYPNRRDDVVPYLLRIACDPVSKPADEEGKGSFDKPGLRQLAAMGCSRFPELSAKYIREGRPDLLEPLEAWLNLGNDALAMERLLLRDDPRISVIAASVIAQSGTQANWETLLDAYGKVQNSDVKWSIIDALARTDTSWVDQNVLRPWVTQAMQDGPAQLNSERSEHLCFLVQKTVFASIESRAFLKRAFDAGQVGVKARAIRALASLQDDDIESWLRPQCEAILCAQDVGLHRAALLALRDIGDAGSLAILRKRRALCLHECELQQLSFQVAEEMYWRLTGGLEGESYTASAFQNVKEVQV